MKTILVTGANGQLGNSIRRLAAGYPQYAFVFTDVDKTDNFGGQTRGKLPLLPWPSAFLKP